MKKFRVFCTDPDATDSSSSDEENDTVPRPAKRKRFIREVNVGGDPPEKPPAVVVPAAAEKKKYPGVRMRKWGKFASEIRHPLTRVRIWLGTFNTAQEAYNCYYMKKLEFDAYRNLHSLANNPPPVVANRDHAGVEGKLAEFGGDNAGIESNLGEFPSKNGGNENQLAEFGGNNGGNEGELGQFGVDNAGIKSKSSELAEFGSNDGELGEFGGNNGGKLGEFGSNDGGVVEGMEVGKVVKEGGGGVEKMKSGKWVGRINYPDSSGRIWMGMFGTMEEAVKAYEKKKAEFQERFKEDKGSESRDGGRKTRVRDLKRKSCGYRGDEEGGVVGDEEGELEGKLPRGVREISWERWEARVWHPKRKTCVSLGRFNSPEEAGLAVRRKRRQFEKMYRYKSKIVGDEEGEFQERFKEDKESESRDGGRKTRVRDLKRKSCGYRGDEEGGVVGDEEGELEGKLPRGVREISWERWEARVWHPKRKTCVSLGRFNSPEEAGLAVRRKRRQFEKMYRYKSKIVGMGDCCKEELPRGVRKTESGKWVARIKHPKKKGVIRLGIYSTEEEAVRAYQKKEAEFDERYKRKKKVVAEAGFVDRDIVLGLPAPSLLDQKEPLKNQVVNFDSNGAPNSEEMPEDGVLPDGITLTKSGRYGVRVTHPTTGDKTWMGSYLTLTEAIRSFNRKMAVFEKRFNSKKKAKLYSEPIVAEKALDTAACYHSPTSVLDTETFSHSPINDDPNDTTVYVPMNSNDEPGNVSCTPITGALIPEKSKFDEAVRLGTINEYGQLLGEFSFLDETIWFGM